MSDRRIAGLSDAKRRLLARRLAALAGADRIPRRDPAGPWPLSFAQRRHWFLHELDPQNPVFNATNAVRISGPLDVAALRRALHALIERHEVLRTGYAVEQWEPVQFVYPEWDYPLPVIDLGADGERGLEHRLRRQIAAAHESRFDLASDLKHRAVLLRIDASEHVLVRTTHRIASDRWSTGIHNRELAALYGAFAGQREADLEPLPIQYADYAVWQRGRFTDEAIRSHLAHFEDRLAGAPMVLELPTDRPRPAIQTNRGETFHETLPAAVADAVRGLAVREGCTPFMVMLAVFAVLLARYGRHHGVVIGVPTAGRTRTETEGLIGLFINTLVVRIRLEPGLAFRDLLQDVRREVVDALAHQELPFERLVEHLQPERHLNRAPVFQVMFDYMNTPTTPLEFSGTRTERLPVAEDGAVYDLSLYAFDEGEEVALAWEYAVELFDRSSIVRMAAAFRSLIQSALAEPEAPVDRLPLLDAGGREEVLAAGRGESEPLEHSTVLEGFERQAASTPSAPALRWQGEDTSYSGLLDAAGRVADELIRRDVAGGERVALLVHRSPALVTGMLGTWMAAAVAVLLDPDHPAGRLRNQLEDAGVRTVLTGGDPPAGLEDLDLRWVRLDLAADRSVPAGRRRPGPSPDDPMYVVFTSGSTGRPKGVEVSHRSVANLVADAVSRYGIGPSDRVLQFASPGFDTVIEEVLPALNAGAVIVHRPPELFASFAEFTAFVADERITVLDLPTAWWHAWVEEMAHTDARGVPEHVRLVIVGGEAARTGAWREWRRLTGSRVRWVNTYGPSETTVVVTAFEPSPSWPGPAGTIMPIGYPIAGAHLTVVDPAGVPVPVGVPGELVVGSAPVALGYIADTDPGGFRPGEGAGRTYHTGDLARLLPGGIFEYLGRTDDQVKVRGLRVEPGDVEAALMLDPEVHTAVVVASDTPGEGSARLVAHVVPVPGRAPDAGRLRGRVARHLPEQMVPSGYVLHESLPLTTSGKIDRAALAGWKTPAPGPVPDGAPATPLEQELAEIWASVLDAPDVTPGSDFFALGGHSLLGIKLLGRIGERLGVELPLRALFEEPTVAGMARLLEERRASG